MVGQGKRSSFEVLWRETLIIPQPFQDVRERDKENIDNFKQAYDLWEAYLDLSQGPMFFRIGRQNLG